MGARGVGVDTVSNLLFNLGDDTETGGWSFCNDFDISIGELLELSRFFAVLSDSIGEWCFIEFVGDFFGLLPASVEAWRFLDFDGGFFALLPASFDA